jgi:hypothetical protein
MILTALSFGLLNTWLIWNSSRSYANARLSDINDAKSTDEAVQRAIATIGAEPKMAQQEFVREAFRERPSKATCRHYILNIIRAVQGDVHPEVERALDRQMVGDLKGFRVYALSTRAVSGNALVESLRRVDPNWNHKLALLDDTGKETRSKDADTFLARFIDRTAQESRPALRNLTRFNGWIQWWTVCVCWIVLLLVAARTSLLAKLVTTGWFPKTGCSSLVEFLAAGHPDPENRVSAASACEYLESVQVESQLDRQVYLTYEFLVALLPSLGFIGTVLGMGDALLTADSLFSASDKNRAISTITSHLGFAFDTTLVGLIAGIVAGSAVLRLRLWENSLWYDHRNPLAQLSVRDNTAVSDLNSVSRSAHSGVHAG